MKTSLLTLIRLLTDLLYTRLYWQCSIPNENLVLELPTFFPYLLSLILENVKIVRCVSK